MKHSLHQSTSLRQELRMNPRLYQAMDLLYMPLLDLQQHLKTELTENPFLDLVDSEDESELPDEITAENQEKEKEESEREDEVDWEEIVLDGFDVAGSRGVSEVRELYEPVPVAVRSLSDHLYEQVSLLDLTPKQKILVDEFIGNIGDDGYLQAKLEEILAGANNAITEMGSWASGAGVVGEYGDEGDPGTELNAAAALTATEAASTAATHEDDSFSMEEVEEVLAIIQKLEPPGVCARNLKECLLLQLRDQGATESLAYRLVNEAFEDLIAHRWRDLSTKFHLSPKEVQDAADLLAKLDPKPGLQYAGSDNVYVTPDLVVDKIDGEYRIFLNDGGMPRLRISQTYQDIASDKKKFVGENREFITNKLNSATWLIQAIEQRRQTMLKVMNFIVDRQREFFDKGVEFLKPLTLREVADVIEMHESTVSRVTNQKYAQTPRGVLPLKFFFSSGLGTTGGEDASARAVKAHIQKLVSDESSAKPLTDSDIVKLLAEKGIKIARRTVAKYRDQLSILPARMRKRV